MSDASPNDLPTTDPRLAGWSRRALIRSGLALGLWSLSGCKGPPRAAATDTMPGPVNGTPPPLAEGPGTPAPQPLFPRSPSAAGDLVIVPRSAWTSAAGPARRNIKPLNGVRRITIHHEGSTPFTAMDERSVAGRIESVRQSHLSRRTKGEPWADIGYHYVIDPSGRVWEARSVQYQGAHVEDQNENNLGIMMLGNFDRQQPTPQATLALDRFVAQQMRRYNVPVQQVRTHQELAPTACPGRSLQGHMLSARGGGGALRLA